MLYEFSNHNKHGNIRTRIVSWPKGKAFGINPKGFGNFIAIHNAGQLKRLCLALSIDLNTNYDEKDNSSTA